jgi:uncharacterized membrane protein
MTSPWSSPPSGFEGWPPPDIPAASGYGPHHVLAGPKPQDAYGVRTGLPVAAFILVTLAVAGVLAGFVWHGMSARPHLIEGPGGSVQLPADTDKNYFGADAAFFAVAGVAGIVTGALAWTAGRRRGPVIPAAVALGSLAAGLLMRAVGEALVTSQLLARNCGHDVGFAGICSLYDGHLRLRALGLTLTWAIAALAVFAAMTALTDRERPQFVPWQPQQWAPPPWPPASGSG